MRVLIAVPRLAMPGGVANYYKTLRPHLDADKVYIEIGGIPGESGRWTRLRRLLGDYWHFNRELSRRRFDLVHLNPSMDVYSVFRDGLFLLIAKAHQRPVLVFFRGWMPVAEAHVRRRIPRLFRWVYGLADANVVLAAEFQRILADMGVSRPTFIETTVVDEGLFSDDAGAGVPRAATEPCTILFLSRLDTGKGVPEAIEAFARLQQRRPEVCLTVAGDGPEREAAEEDVRRRGLTGVRFLGHVGGPAKRRAFQEADIYLFTSLAEGMPNSVLEAMAWGLPVVTRPVGGIRDFFDEGRMGYAVDSQDPGAFTEALARLVANPALRGTMGQWNRAFARQRFAASVVARRLLDIYQQVVPGVPSI